MSKRWPRSVSSAMTREAERVGQAGTKASGDAGFGLKQQIKTKNKTKIPKNIRYELENALVSLCDVWFEDIKPHLVRNNIKLHIHEGDGRYGGVFHGRGSPQPPVCSHADPGAASDHRRRRTASCVDCCPTPPTASGAPCPRRGTSEFPRLSSPPQRIAGVTRFSSSPCKKYEEAGGSKTRKKPLTTDMCQTYTILTPPFTPQCPKNINKYTRKSKTAHKSTQTEPMAVQSSHRNGEGVARPPRRSCKAARAQCHRSRARTAILPPKNKPVVQQTVKPLFNNELINIIGEQNDKILRSLYVSPLRTTYPSTMNLVDNNGNTEDFKKTRPWR